MRGGPQGRLETAWGMIAFAAITAIAFAANQHDGRLSWLMPLGALLLPWLSPRRPSPSLFALRNAGWGWALAAILLALVVPLLGLWAVVTGVFRVILIWPMTGDVASFVIERTGLFLFLALAEEVFFRGYLQETVFASLWGGRGWKVVSFKNAAASLLFGLLHVVGYLQPHRFVTALGSLYLGWLMERSERSIWPVVVVHTAANLALAWTGWVARLNLPTQASLLLVR